MVPIGLEEHPVNKQVRVVKTFKSPILGHEKRVIEKKKGTKRPYYCVQMKTSEEDTWDEMFGMFDSIEEAIEYANMRERASILAIAKHFPSL